MRSMNEGAADRVIRIVLALALAYAAWLLWPGAASLVMIGFAAIAVVTAAIGWCPLYSVLDVSTRRRLES